MIQYKYTLDKSSKKFICPKCNKKTFVLFIETETGNYLAETFGRCDRETNCGHYNTLTGELKNTFEVVNIPKPKSSYHSYSLVSQSGRNFKENTFVQFLRTIFSDSQVQEVILKYLIGTSKHWSGATVFWQIDNNQNVRHGKIMLINPYTGKRVKNNEGKGFISSVRSVLKLNDFNLSQCLFGLHLINETNLKTIAIVESEKTAVIMSVFKPQYTWLSTGSKGGLKNEYLHPIKQFKIVAFPDKSEYNDWLTKATQLNGFGYKIVVNDWLEHQTSFADGTDLADVCIQELKEHRIQKPNETHYTESEIIIHEIEQYKPEIWELIKTFDLVDYNYQELKKIINEN
jgi:hypothetical protein